MGTRGWNRVLKVKCEWTCWVRILYSMYTQSIWLWLSWRFHWIDVLLLKWLPNRFPLLRSHRRRLWIFIRQASERELAFGWISRRRKKNSINPSSTAMRSRGSRPLDHNSYCAQHLPPSHFRRHGNLCHRPWRPISGEKMWHHLYYFWFRPIGKVEPFLVVSIELGSGVAIFPNIHSNPESIDNRTMDLSGHTSPISTLSVAIEWKWPFAK